MTNDDDETSVVVGIIRDLTKRVDDYERKSSADRQAFKTAIEENMIQLRRDFHAALAPIQLNEIDHRRVHETDRNERAVDAVDRLNRQLTYNLWMGALTALVVLNLLLIGFVVIRVALVLSAR